MNSLFCFHYKATSHWQADSQLSPEKQGSIKMKLWEDKCHNSECCLLSSFPAVFIAGHDAIRYGMAIWSVRVSCPRCAPSQYLGYPIAGGCEEQKRPFAQISPVQQ